MKTATVILGIAVFLFIGLFAFRSSGKNEAKPVQAGIKTAVFAVAWYDVGKAALEGLQGVIKVTSGWRGRNEVNEVRYNPAEVSVSDMESVLRRSGTYIKTLESGP